MAKQKNNTTDMVQWDKLWAEQAEAAVAQEAGVGGGQFFSIKGGVLSFGGNPIPNNEMAVIILDSVNENVYSSTPYQQGGAFNPECFAFGRDETMAPHKDAREKQHADCASCPLNEFGSGTGAGKACKNRRRLALVSAGNLTDGELKITTAKDVTDSTVGYLALPPTSLRAWAEYVKSLKGVLKRPPRGVVTKVMVQMDEGGQYPRVVFEPMGPVPDGLAAAVVARAKLVADTIEFPYQPQAEGKGRKPVDKVPPKGNGAAAAAKKPRKF